MGAARTGQHRRSSKLSAIRGFRAQAMTCHMCLFGRVPRTPHILPQSCVSTGSLSNSIAPNAHSYTRYSGSRSAKRCSASCPSMNSLKASARLGASPRWRSRSRFQRQSGQGHSSDDLGRPRGRTVVAHCVRASIWARKRSLPRTRRCCVWARRSAVSWGTGLLR